ncbi:MAG: efflux RND transporter permease subunit, partial [Pirellulales bacterium]|nr:efflux RND transporter permease subunit [Pirellulales bacterium]
MSGDKANLSNLFFRNPRLLVLAVALILVGGASSYYLLPRMEDPLLTPRVAMITTRFPGADAERVESLVTEKLEEELQEIDEIKELRSLSRAGISTLNIELRDEIYEVDSVWSRIRDKLDDAQPELPADA